MSPAKPPVPVPTPATLAASGLPVRVHRILDTYLSNLTGELTARINDTLLELEQQMFRRAEAAHSNEAQTERLANLHTLRRHRSDLLPQLLSILEAQLASIRVPQPVSDGPGAGGYEYRNLSLVEDDVMEREVALRDIVRRHETRSHTALYLLGQRFGVLAGSPAFDVSRIPGGPQSLCSALHDAAPLLRIDLESQLLLYRAFEQRALAEYDGWLGVLNGLLAGEGVLPGLIFLPPRTRTERATPPPEPKPPGGSSAAYARRERPMTDWAGLSPSAWTTLMAALASQAAPEGNVPAGTPAAGDAEAFAGLQQLLSGRRARIAAANPATASPASPTDGGTPVPTGDVLSALRALQAQPVRLAEGIPHRTLQDLRDHLLAQARSRFGAGATLTQQDADTFELLGMLYGEIEREIRRDAPAAEMLVKLQAPVAQAALRDTGFFVRPQHPARELLNTVAESGAVWLDDGGDPHLVQRLRQTVDKVVTHYDGDEAVFEQANREVQDHFLAAARKAEVTERRHVEAARGKDRLETAKLRAAETVEAALKERRQPKFVQALLKQAWADVLTLTLLRNGEDSPQWQEALDLTGRIAAITSGADAVADEELAARVESELAQVGYHEDEAAAIARRLSSTGDDDTSRTELTARLKARAKLGEQSEVRKKVQAPRTPREQELFEYLRTLPFGTWFEFIRNQQGDVVRQRLSWYSPITDHALFVNQRGQPAGEQSLDSVARLMAQEQVRVVTEDRGRLIDRAWRATLGALRSLTGGGQ